MEKPNKYLNGKIYTIRSHQTDKFYIGSTCSPLHKRLFKHRSNKRDFDNKRPIQNSTRLQLARVAQNFCVLHETHLLRLGVCLVVLQRFKNSSDGRHGLVDAGGLFEPVKRSYSLQKIQGKHPEVMHHGSLSLCIISVAFNAPSLGNRIGIVNVHSLLAFGFRFPHTLRATSINHEQHRCAEPKHKHRVTAGRLRVHLRRLHVTIRQRLQSYGCGIIIS